MLGGEGYFRGSSVLISGTAGTGKTSLAAYFANATCARGERCLYLAFEESPAQLVRNMTSIGVDLNPWVKKGLLRLEASRPSLHGIEMHLATIHKMVNDFDPQVVIIDPISNFSSAGSGPEAEAMLLRLIDFLKSRQITAMFLNLTAGGNAWEHTDVGVSSLIDTWILLRDIELGGERNRGLYVLKSRGMKHSNQIREYLITSDGVLLQDVYIGPEGVLTGSMRAAQEDREKAATAARALELTRKQRDLARKRSALEAQIAALRAEFESVEDESKIVAEQDKAREREIEQSRGAAGIRRGADAAKRNRK
jgi:circadian clock protein KaiC